MLIVDTSVLISYLSGTNTKETRLLAELERRDISFAIPNLCVQEVLQGAKDEKSWKLLKEYLTSQVIVSVKDPIASIEAAARIFFECRRKGLTVRSSTDCLIAQIVIEQDGELLHKDKDYLSIAKVRDLRFAKLS